MAFTTRTGRVVAIGNGSMVVALVLWWVSIVFLLLPIGTSVAWLLWMAWPARRAEIEGLLPGALAASITALSMILMLRMFTTLPMMGAFIGPDGLLRDHVRATVQSRTARKLILGGIIAVALMTIMQVPFGPPRALLIIGLTLALVLVDVLTTRGLLRIARSVRSAPYLSGMIEEQKVIADRPWPTRPKPSFPETTSLDDAADSRRYARRATDIAQIHEWTGAGLIVVFSAFVGTAISPLWESQEPGPPIPMLIVLGLLAFGFWLQRRGRSYRRLSDAFEARAAEIEGRPRRSLDARGRALRRHRNR
ncbi:MAG: hypothetical protein ACQEW8_12025 [Actinomycetota bacterium]